MTSDFCCNVGKIVLQYNLSIGEKVKVVTTDKNRYVDTKEADEKLGIMDLRAELREKAIRDEHAALAYATEKRNRGRNDTAELNKEKMKKN